MLTTNKRAATRLTRSVVPGTRRADEPGDKLRLLVLCRGREEWVGVETTSGAFLRVDLGSGTFPPTCSVVEVILAKKSPPDPGRREAIAVEEAFVALGHPRPRPLARLLKRLSVKPATASPLLGTRGPSLSYLDLDERAPSLVLLALERGAFEASRRGDEAVATIDLQSSLEILPVRDERVRRLDLKGPLSGDGLRRALGFSPAYALVGLDRVEDGHARKVVLAMLAKTGVPL